MVFFFLFFFIFIMTCWISLLSLFKQILHRHLKYNMQQHFILLFCPNLACYLLLLYSEFEKLHHYQHSLFSIIKCLIFSIRKYTHLLSLRPIVSITGYILCTHQLIKYIEYAMEILQLSMILSKFNLQQSWQGKIIFY